MRTIGGVITVPRGFFCKKDALGTTYPISVAGVTGLLATPHLPAGFETNSDLLRQPLAPPGLSDSKIVRNRWPLGWAKDNWGRAEVWPTGVSSVHAVYVRFDVETKVTSSQKAVEIGNRLQASWPEWWMLLTQWSDILTSRAWDNSSMVLMANRPWLHYWNELNQLQEAKDTPGQIIVRRKDPTHALSKEQLEKAANNASANLNPKLEHLLLRDARFALLMHEYRRAVIDAATAAEVVVSNAADDKLRQSYKTKFAKTMLGKFKTLGDRITLCSLLKIELPEGAFHEELVNIRNKAAHEGKSPSPQEARKALTLAAAIVNALSPIS